MDVDERPTDAVVDPAENASSPSLSLPSANGLGRITKLSDETINRIAAGEVVQRPSSALKELLENAIDAGSTNIKVTVKDGGFKLLSIQDNGHGIQKADLPLLCERFATSKLKTYDDLSSIATYGFRGEALASISHVSHLTVTTKTREAPCGFKARYVDGKLVPLVANSSDAEPRTTAANDGTLLLVEDLFYNTPSRRKGLRSPADEYSRILDVVSKYAIHNAGIAMSCKKSTSNSSDLNTAVNAEKLEIIGQVYGDLLRRETRELAFENKEFFFTCQGHLSGQNYSAKKATYIFFINNRLVDCSPLRRNLDVFYQSILPKGGCPFVYLSLRIQPDRVDVNVSPTKNEVHFLDQEDIIEVICNEMQRKLAAANETRTYIVQTLLPGADTIAPPVITPRHGNEMVTQTNARITDTGTTKVPAQRLVRTDATAQTLDAMFGQSQGTQTATTNSRKRSAAEMTQAEAEPAVQIIDSSDSEEEEGDSLDSRSKYRSGAPTSQAVQTTQPVRRSKIPLASCNLTSVRELREDIVTDLHKELGDIVKGHTFVGVIDIDIGQSMLQYGTKLYLVNHNILMEELFYQLGLRQFGAIGKFNLNPPPLLRELLSIAIEDDPNHKESGFSAEKIVDIIHDRLTERAEMLDEYFSLAISTDTGQLRSIPMILPGWSPDLDKLPLLLLRLGTEVDWTSEKGCFSTLLREMAFFNTADPLPHLTIVEKDADGVQIAEIRSKQKREQQSWQLQHIVFPAMRHLQPPLKLIDSKAIVHVASLENLYKVFERC